MRYAAATVLSVRLVAVYDKEETTYLSDCQRHNHISITNYAPFNLMPDFVPEACIYVQNRQRSSGKTCPS